MSGDPVTEDGAGNEMTDADPDQVARLICLRQLAAAARSRGQLAEALDRRNVPADVAERVLDRLTQVGLVDDAAFAETFVRSRHRGRGLARRALADELRSRGVDAETTAEAVAGLDPAEERETARRIAERKLQATRGLDVQSRVRRAVGMLSRRGYPAGLAFDVVREALAAETDRAANASDRVP